MPPPDKARGHLSSEQVADYSLMSAITESVSGRVLSNRTWQVSTGLQRCHPPRV
jgi:hypothetical protein